MDHIAHLLKTKSTAKPLISFRIVQRFNCGHIRTTAHAKPATIDTWDMHEDEVIITERPEDTVYVHICERIEVYQQHRGMKRFYIIKAESLPVTIIP
jgi:hypothetical protein